MGSLLSVVVLFALDLLRCGRDGSEDAPLAVELFAGLSAQLFPGNELFHGFVSLSFVDMCAPLTEGETQKCLAGVFSGQMLCYTAAVEGGKNPSGRRTITKEVFNMYVLIALVLLPFVVLSELLKLTK